jgi:hypothetical protein
MDAVASEMKRSNQLPDLDSLGVESLKALVLAKQTEIENLNLLVLKLKRMHFGQRSEKLSADIAQLELLLEDLEASQAAANPLPEQVVTSAAKEKHARKACSPSASRRTASRKPNPRTQTRSLPRLRWQTARPRRRHLRSSRIRACPLESDLHCKAEAELRLLLTHRAGTRTAQAHR